MRSRDFTNDLNVRGAFSGTSFVPEKREAQTVADYVAFMQTLQQELVEFETEDNRDELEKAFEAFRAGYAKRLNTYYDVRRGMVSTMVVGSSGWTSARVRQQERRGSLADRRLREAVEFRDKALKRLRERFNPVLQAKAPVRTEDPEAIEKLKARLAEAEAFQETMKKANRIIRAGGPDVRERLINELGINTELVEQILNPPFGKPGFPSASLSNNNAKIRRIKKRIGELEARSEQEDFDERVGEVVIEHAISANRIRLRFPDKPSDTLRRRLKRNGFRWSPRTKVWQAYYNPYAVAKAKEIAMEVQCG